MAAGPTALAGLRGLECARGQATAASNSSRQSLKLEDVERTFAQDNSGVRVQFTVSRHCLGKAMNEDLSNAMRVLLPDD